MYMIWVQLRSYKTVISSSPLEVQYPTYNLISCVKLLLQTPPSGIMLWSWWLLN